MNHSPQSAPAVFPELIAALRDIAERTPRSPDEMQALAGECRALTKAIGDLGLGDACPEPIWHYLSDADIRFKDREYADRQRRLFISALEAWLQAAGRASTL